MRHFLYYFVFLTLIGLSACKHPLAIDGEGDIVEITNSGRGCTLEQFQSQDSACTDNAVTGEYFVNYKAVPRPGWRFVAWNGLCDLSSTFQHCRFEVTEDVVDWWDARHPDADMPATTAIFAPITGERGQLMGTGTPVAGIAYTTATLNGVTDTDGSFYYQTGENVRFSLGDTLLGEVPGQALVDPFAMSGSPPLTGTAINRALQSTGDPFHAVINIVALLETLDNDRDPTNGITINPHIAILFDGVELNLGRDWTSFSEDIALQNVLSRGNRRQVFEAPRHVPTTPAPALTRLYEYEGLSTPTVAVVREDHDEGNDGVTDDFFESSYDAVGNLVSRNFENWSYDSLGNTTTHTVDETAIRSTESQAYNTAGQPTRYTLDANSDGDVEASEDWSYDSNGMAILWERDNNGDGVIDAVSRWQYSYNNNRLRRIDWSATGNESLFAIITYRYHGNGLLRRIELTGSEGALPRAIEPLDIPDIQYLELARSYTVSYQHSQGAMTADTREAHHPDLGRYTESRSYDGDGNVSHNQTRLVQYGSPNSEDSGVYDYQYDDRGNPIREAVDDDGDGRNDFINHYSYDEHGQVVREAADDDADGSIDHASTYSYDSNGNVTLRTIDNNGDGIDEEAESWNYHYEYDERGNITRQERTPTWRDRPNDILVYEYYSDDSVAYEEHQGGSGNYRARTAWQYNDDGAMTLEENDQNIDGSIESRAWYGYNDWGNRDRLESDANGDGIMDRLETWQYDNRGNLTRYELECFENETIPFPACIYHMYDPFSRAINYHYDEQHQLLRKQEFRYLEIIGEPDSIATYEYDSKGRVIRETEDLGADGTLERITSFTYDDQDRVIHQEVDEDGNGSVDHNRFIDYDEHGNIVREGDDEDGDGVYENMSVTSRVYDADGNQLQWTEDRDNDGQPDAMGEQQFDASGNLIRRSEDERADGSPDRVWTWRYGPDNDLEYATVLEDDNNDGSLNNSTNRTYQPTGWGHVFQQAE
jgi:serralysin